jgi:hypothetical protein
MGKNKNRISKLEKKKINRLNELEKKEVLTLVLKRNTELQGVNRMKYTCREREWLSYR